MPRNQAAEAPYTPSTLPEQHIVVRLGPPQGSSNFVCSDPAGVERLVELPNKIKRTSFAARGESKDGYGHARADSHRHVCVCPPL
jgi:hypothetical protein